MDAGEGTESFVSISAAIFELSRKSGRGEAAESAPPDGARANLTSVTSGDLNIDLSEK